MLFALAGEVMKKQDLDGRGWTILA